METKETMFDTFEQHGSDMENAMSCFFKVPKTVLIFSLCLQKIITSNNLWLP